MSAWDNARMPTFHHANLGVPPDLANAEADFLVGVLGYRRLEPPESAAAFGARWFEADDGSQVHLSLDPDHAPAAMAHVAIAVTGESDAIEARLVEAGFAFKTAEFDGTRIILCKDPAGNRWELRS
jgi:catechol 2,3-dioxygenase-like lactoylglutathione lyase family enzyme